MNIIMNTMTTITTTKIKLWGIVQGVGFRPFVAKVAEKLGMKGEVLNIGGLVEITVTDTGERVQQFIDALISNKPEPAEIVHIKCTPLEYREFSGFEIIRSGEGDDEAAMIPSDLAICSHCLEELYDEDDPRYQHPFISCMICGPRYTIIDRIPYDRDNTSMVDFPMCDFCESEYTDLHDRRHHAQTISCHNCGPQLMWEEPGACLGLPDDTAILDRAAELLKKGGVIAFKSVGGYNLLADPFNGKAVEKLRQAKNRESKPFAVMFRSLEEIRRYCYVDDVEAKLLQSSARPIILLEHRPSDSEEINRSRFIGSFLPGFAAQYMLLDRISPLIFTSANPSNLPMIKDDAEMLNWFDRVSPLVDAILYNKREIRVRADDSVTRVIDNQPQMIRRSKGYAPVPLYVESGSSSPARCILATGSQLKNSFALSKGSFSYMSQYFGDMDTLENQTVYRENVDRMAELFRIKPEMVACDQHPLYFTTAFAEEYAKANGLPLHRVQHHHAHIASVMAENNLEGPVIGVSFDGTGYGTDGCIWGGEFMLCEGAEMTRVAHLRYVDMIGGDSSMKDGVRSALSYIAARNPDCGDDEISVDISDILDFGSERLMRNAGAPLILKAIETGTNTIKSSSMGRLFDAVSCLLGICDYNDYEGQCAIMLEDAAAFASANPGADRACDLALSFHRRIIDMIMEQCCRIRGRTGISRVALSGGSFQNKILMEGILDRLRSDDFEPHYNISVSPNDGGIALGQLFVAMHLNKK
ncbi:MAG: carbamoyltransferase HypF [Bacillota bacterium]|nr:carbamoyltransferase HypF [Bacillota bacterium]